MRKFERSHPVEFGNYDKLEMARLETAKLGNAYCLAPGFFSAVFVRTQKTTRRYSMNNVFF